MPWAWLLPPTSKMSLQQISSEVPELLYCLTLLQWPSWWEGRKRKEEERGEQGRKVLFPHFHFQILILCKFLLWSVSVGAIQEDSRKCWFRLAKLIQSNATVVLVSKLWFPVSYSPKRQLKGKTWKWMLFQMWFYKSIKLNENANLLVTGHYTCCCSVAHSCLTTCNLRDCRTLGLPVPPISRSLPKFKSIASVMPSSHLILWPPLLFPPSIFPSIRDFSNELAVHIRWPKAWSLSFSIWPFNEYSGFISFKTACLDLLAARGTLSSLL